MPEQVIPELDEALDMELGSEDDYESIGQNWDRARLALAFIGEAIAILGAMLIMLGFYLDVPEGIVTGIVMIVVTVLCCIMPIVALELKKYQYAAESSSLDSQTQQMDYDWWEQIDVEDRELVMLPQMTLDNELICWNEEELQAEIDVLKQSVERVGGRSYLHETVMDRIVDHRIKEIIIERQEMNIIQRFIMWLFKIQPMLIPVNFQKLADNWVSFAIDQTGFEYNNRVSSLSGNYEHYKDKDGETAIAFTERFTILSDGFSVRRGVQAFGRDEEEDIGSNEEAPCGAQTWEVREIKAFEKELRDSKRISRKVRSSVKNISTRIRRRARATFRNPYHR